MRRLFVPLALVVTAALAGCAAPGVEQPARLASVPAPTGPPRLIVAISVDQFSADLFAQYRPHYRYGLARLTGGAVFPSGYQSHAASETCPGHSTLLTGNRPARTGIIANTWYEPGGPRGTKPIYCAEDDRNPASTAKNPVVSAYHLKVPTLGEYMKAADPRSRNVAVSAKDRAVMMMGGHTIDAAYWWKGAGFVTLAGRDLAPAALTRNAAISATLKAGAPALAAPAWCAPTDRSVALGTRGSTGQGRFALPALASEAKAPDLFRISPRMDAATIDLATGLVDELALGQLAAPDILSVSLSATDYIGHATGTAGLEMCIQIAELDKHIGRLLDHLDKLGIDYLVVLSADHGGLDTPERLDQQALPRAVRVDPALLPSALGKAVSDKTGITVDGPLLVGEGASGDIYVNRAVPAAQRGAVVQALVAQAKANPQVAAVFTADELAKTPLPAANPQDWTLKERARASFDPARSGDVVILLDRAIVPIPEPIPGAYIATHGSAWDYDRRVPMLFWRRGVPGFEQPQPVETVDIAPTLAAILGLRLSDGTFDGRCLDIDAGADNTCVLP